MKISRSELVSTWRSTVLNLPFSKDSLTRSFDMGLKAVASIINILECNDVDDIRLMHQIVVSHLQW